MTLLWSVSNGLAGISSRRAPQAIGRGLHDLLPLRFRSHGGPFDLRLMGRPLLYVFHANLLRLMQSLGEERRGRFPDSASLGKRWM